MPLDGGVGEDDEAMGRGRRPRRSKSKGEGMAHGTVKWFNPDKGYGFIDPDDGEPEIFVHYSGIQGRGYRSLEAGQRVEYRTMPGTRGPQATAVRPEGSLEQRPVGRLRTADRPQGWTAGRSHGQRG